jgi:hypothetical protein
VVLLQLELEVLPVDSDSDFKLISCSTILICNSSIHLAWIGILRWRIARVLWPIVFGEEFLKQLWLIAHAKKFEGPNGGMKKYSTSLSLSEYP